MRLLPRRRRFGAAMLAARPLVEVVRRTPQYRVLEDTRFDSGRERALHLLLHALTTNGAAFDPRITIDGYERFVAELRRGRGVLLVSPHTALVLLMLRRFHDDGIAPFVVAVDAGMRIPGTAAPVETVQRSATSMVRVRSRLRHGRLVCAMLDRAAHEPNVRTTQLDTALGPVIFAPALLHLAARCDSSVAFCEAHLEGRRVRGAITLATGTSGAALEREYVAFIRSLMSRRAASVPLVSLERAAT
jgi:predicted LPLAT superfamily acyltransferase